MIPAFLVGQVQYACSSYFCTMMQRPVSAPAMTMDSKARSCEDLSNCTHRIALPQYGLQLVENNCIKVVTSKKSVVSSFTDSAKLIGHFVTVLASIPALNGDQSAIGNPLIATNNAASPPQGLHILNCNLRI